MFAFWIVYVENGLDLVACASVWQPFAARVVNHLSRLLFTP